MSDEALPLIGTMGVGTERMGLECWRVFLIGVLEMVRRRGVNVAAVPNWRWGGKLGLVGGKRVI
jgi:hypothetical protein